MRSLDIETSDEELKELLENQIIQEFIIYCQENFALWRQRPGFKSLVDTLGLVDSATDELVRISNFQHLPAGVVYIKGWNENRYLRIDGREILIAGTGENDSQKPLIIDSDKYYITPDSVCDKSGRFMVVSLSVEEGSNKVHIIDLQTRSVIAEIFGGWGSYWHDDGSLTVYGFGKDGGQLIGRFDPNSHNAGGPKDEIDIYNPESFGDNYQNLEAKEAGGNFLSPLMLSGDTLAVLKDNGYSQNSTLWIEPGGSFGDVDQVIKKTPLFNGEIGEKKDLVRGVLVKDDKLYVHLDGDSYPFGVIKVIGVDEIKNGQNFGGASIFVAGDEISSIRSITALEKYLVINRTENIAYSRIEIYDLNGEKVDTSVINEELVNKRLTINSVLGDTFVIESKNPIEPLKIYRYEIKDDKVVLIDSLGNPENPHIDQQVGLLDSVIFIDDVEKLPLPVRIFEAEISGKVRTVVCEIYGGFGLNNLVFSDSYLERFNVAGGNAVYAMAGLPGGGEYFDKDWRDVSPDRHEVVEGGIVVLKALAQRYPNAEIMINGASNGGLSAALILIEILNSDENDSGVVPIDSIKGINLEFPVLTLGPNIKLSRSGGWESEYGNSSENPQILDASPEHLLAKLLADPRAIEKFRAKLITRQNPLIINITIGLQDRIINPLSSIPSIVLLKELSKELSGLIALNIIFNDSTHSNSYDTSPVDSKVLGISV